MESLMSSILEARKIDLFSFYLCFVVPFFPHHILRVKFIVLEQTILAMKCFLWLSNISALLLCLITCKKKPFIALCTPERGGHFIRKSIRSLFVDRDLGTNTKCHQHLKQYSGDFIFFSFFGNCLINRMAKTSGEIILTTPKVNATLQCCKYKQIGPVKIFFFLLQTEL